MRKKTIRSEEELLIRSLTIQQKTEIRVLQRDLVVKAPVGKPDCWQKKVLNGLVKKGIVVFDLKTETYSLAPVWEMKDLLDGMGVPTAELFEHEKEAPDKESTASITRKEYTRPSIPDAPHAIVRPAAIYSNRSQQELIDHILKTY